MENPQRTFRAFVIYCDLGPARSIDAAFSQRGKPGKRSGPWRAWTGKYAWVDRAAAFDAAVAKRNLQATLEEHLSGE